MSEPAELSAYTEAQLSEAAAKLPAVSHYLQILKQPGSGEMADQLRLQRHRAWLRCALATYFETTPTKVVCRYWSEVADILVSQAWKEIGFGEGIGLFALGKLGSFELNLSSDIDVLFVCEGEAPLAKVRKFKNMLSESGSLGFCYRVDVDLRPGGTQGPVVPTVSAFEDYYGSFGETWERLAFIRLRPLAGDKKIISHLQAFTEKFVYRRHLDYTLLDDLQSLRKKIHQQYRHRSSMEVVNLKTIPGGIRDIELFVHALLVIHGGKRRDLRTVGTDEALRRLAASKLITRADADKLIEVYWELRALENLAQAERDLQTHEVLRNPRDTDPQWAQLLKAKLAGDLAWVSEHVGEVIGKPEDENKSASFPAEAGQQREWLKERLGLEDLFLDQHPKLFQGPLYSSDTARDREARQEFLSTFLLELKEISPELEFPLLLLEDFLNAIKAKATLYTLLLREPALRKNLAMLFSYSPFLSRVLCNRPELLDALLLHRQEFFSDDPELQMEEFAERKMMSEILAGMDFLSDRRVTKLSETFTDTADEVASHLLESLMKTTGCQDLDILCLGKWGGRELGFKSDLDFIFISDNEGSEDCAKAARRFLNRISENVKGGKLYSVDMRLRPSGSAGPMLISKRRLEDFLAKEAPAWQRLAYTKARSLKKDRPISATQKIYERGLSAEDLTELRSIMQRIFAEKDSSNLKYAPGGLIDTELAVQTAILFHHLPVDNPSTRSMVHCLKKAKLRAWEEEGSALLKDYFFMRQVEQLIRLSGNSNSSKLDGVYIVRLSKLLFECEPEHLMRRVWEVVAGNLTRLKELDPRRLDE